MNPLAAKNDSPRYSPDHTDTMIGADVCVEGSIRFTGVLRVQGRVLGDLSCDKDDRGTLVVDGSGSISGKIVAPHIVIKGQASGPLHASQSLQIHQGAHVVGDASYGSLDIHSGGVFEGLLTPMPPLDAQALRQEHRPAFAPGSGRKDDAPGLAPSFGGKRSLAAIAVLAVAAAGAAWVWRGPAAVAPPPAENAPINDEGKRMAAPAASNEKAGPQDGAAETARATAAATADANAATAAETSAGGRADADSDKVVTVQGVNPSKPGGIFLLTSKAPAVLFKKKRTDHSDGTRVEVPPGKKLTVAIGPDEIFRVADGRDIEIIFQGRKVAPRIIESSTWMSFVPQ